MNSWKTYIGELQSSLSKSRVITHACVKVRNQMAGIIGKHLGKTADSYLNGEYALLDKIAPLCNTFVDVGANVGEWTKYFLSLTDASGILYQPSAQSYSVLQTQLSRKAVTIHNFALSDEVGTLLFIEEPGCGQTSSAWETHSPSDIAPKQIKVSTLDNELLSINSFIDFLKIDTEGYDFKVLKGAQALLAEKRIRFIQFEYNSNWICVGASLTQAIGYLKEFGYEIFLIRNSGLHPFNYNLWGDFFHYSNFFACKRSDLQWTMGILKEEI